MLVHLSGLVVMTIKLLEIDRWGRRQTDLVAMDALVFHSYAAQLKPGTVKIILLNSSIFVA